MKNRILRKSPLAAAVSMALGAQLAWAQDEEEAPAAAGGAIEEVVVTGIRQSLKRSMDLKRNSVGVVDGISAEDIGDFPDSNLAESLQRITGVSIDRERGEGSRVTVRGFGPDFNLVLLNDRQMPTSALGSGTIGRSFDFANLASENIAAVEVYKSGRASVPSGGIGSTLNIRTTRPLDAGRLVATAAVSGVHDLSTEEGSDWTPQFSGLFSNTYADNTVGIALSATYQERDNGFDNAQVGGWRDQRGGVGGWGAVPDNEQNMNVPGEGDVYAVPQSIGYEFNEFEQKRLNGQLTFQFRPREDVEVTLDHTYAEFELERRFTNLSAWFNFGAQESVWTDGPVASPSEYTENLPNSDFSMGGGTDGARNELTSTGLNLVWDVTDNLVMELDYHDSTAESEPNSRWGNSALLSMASFTRSRTSGYFEAGSLPVLELGLTCEEGRSGFYGCVPGTSRPLSADDMIVTGSVFSNGVADMDLEQTTLRGAYTFDAGFVESIDFGIQLTEVDYRSASSVVQRDAWGGVTQPGAISDLLTQASAAGAFDEISGGSDPRLQTEYFTWDLAEVVARTEALIASGEADFFMSPDLGDCGTGLCPSSDFTTDRRTQEETQAAYVQISMATEIFGKAFSSRLGLRYERTDVSSQALVPSYTELVWVAGNELSPIRGDESDFTSLEGDYGILLPNLDLRLDLTDDVTARASFSKTLTRPNFDHIQGGQTIAQIVRINGGDGNRGNPALEPFESENIDLSLEWYYDDESYFSIGYFHKDVENFIGTETVIETPFNLPHPALGPLWDEAVAATGTTESGANYSWILENRPNAEGVDAAAGRIAGVPGRDPASPFRVVIPINIEEATLSGWEINLQHNFGETGFGFIVNGTFVDGDVEYDRLSLNQQFVLNGLSDSANLIAFYENDRLGVRVTYNWRDSFLAGLGQANVGGQTGSPTFVDDYGQWDLNVNYWWTDNLQMSLDVINVTDETRHLYGRDEQQVLFAQQFGVRYTLGLRYKF